MYDIRTFGWFDDYRAGELHGWPERRGDGERRDLQVTVQQSNLQQKDIIAIEIFLFQDSE